jgi:hypothetical protein
MASKRCTYETVREIGRALPGIEESTSYGTPALKVKGKLLVRLKEDGESIVVKTTFEDREYLMRDDPATFYITDHYRDWPMVLVRLSRVKRAVLQELIEVAWRRNAPRSLLAAREVSSPASRPRRRPS